MLLVSIHAVNILGSNTYYSTFLLRVLAGPYAEMWFGGRVPKALEWRRRRRRRGWGLGRGFPPPQKNFGMFSFEMVHFYVF